MRRSTYCSLVYCLLLLCWSILFSVHAAAQAEQPVTLVIEGGTLIEGKGERPFRTRSLSSGETGSRP